MSYIGGNNNNYQPSLPGGGGGNYNYGGGGGGGANYMPPNANNAPVRNIGAGGNDDACCVCGQWCLDHNPYRLANSLGPDILWAARYKQCMVIGTVSATVAFFGFVLRKDVCGFFNFIAFLHLISVAMPCCHKAMPPFYWSLISIGSIIASVGSFLFGLINGCAAGAGIINALIIMLEMGNLYVLSRMDSELKNKVKTCCAECGCCGREAQIQTMIPQQESRFVNNAQMNAQVPINAPPPQMIRGGGMGSLNGYETGPTNWNNNTPLNGGGNQGYVGNDAGTYYSNPQNYNNYNNQMNSNMAQFGEFNGNYGQNQTQNKRKSGKSTGSAHYLQYQTDKPASKAQILVTATNSRPPFLSDVDSEASTPNPIAPKPPRSPPPALPSSPKPQSISTPRRISPPPPSYTSSGTNYKAPAPPMMSQPQSEFNTPLPEYVGERKIQQMQVQMAQQKRASNSSHKIHDKTAVTAKTAQIKNWKRNHMEEVGEEDEVEFEGMSELGGMDSASHISSKSGEKAGSLIFNSSIQFENAGNTLRREQARLSPRV